MFALFLAFEGGGQRTSLIGDLIRAGKLDVGHPAPPGSDDRPCGYKSHHGV